jgi:hypothetical protein
LCPAAKAEANAIAALEGGDFTLLKSSGIPAQDVLALARTVIEARVAQRHGDKAAAIERFEQAAALQDGLPYMEPPYWYYPAEVARSRADAGGPTRQSGGSSSSAHSRRAPSNTQRLNSSILGRNSSESYAIAVRYKTGGSELNRSRGTCLPNKVDGVWKIGVNLGYPKKDAFKLE